ncbi:MAG: hypothetical protein MHMPM18_001915 [Marteilia pararefringens]
MYHSGPFQSLFSLIICTTTFTFLVLYSRSEDVQVNVNSKFFANEMYNPCKELTEICPSNLRYESILSGLYSAKCSFGDLHQITGGQLICRSQEKILDKEFCEKHHHYAYLAPNGQTVCKKTNEFKSKGKFKELEDHIKVTCPKHYELKFGLCIQKEVNCKVNEIQQEYKCYKNESFCTHAVSCHRGYKCLDSKCVDEDGNDMTPLRNQVKLYSKVEYSDTYDYEIRENHLGKNLECINIKGNKTCRVLPGYAYELDNLESVRKIHEFR